MKALVDRHHADLLYSLQRLFEDRLGYDVFVPVGTEWFDAGYWQFGSNYVGRALADQFLGIDAHWREVEDGVWLTFDPAHPERPLYGVTLAAALRTGWDVVVATVDDNQRGFRRFADETGAKYAYHVGNTRAFIDWDLAPLALIAAENAIPEGARGVHIGEEIDSDTTFAYRAPVRADRIASFVNLAPRIPEVWGPWTEAQAHLPSHRFRSFGHDCPDGNLHPVQHIADEMGRSGWAWHDKPTGDGFGQVIHAWAAVGRPLIGHSSYYVGQRAFPLWQDGVTCVDLTLHSVPEAMAMVAEISADRDRHEEMCRAIRRTFEGLYDWRSDARVVAELLR